MLAAVTRQSIISIMEFFMEICPLALLYENFFHRHLEMGFFVVF